MEGVNDSACLDQSLIIGSERAAAGRLNRLALLRGTGNRTNDIERPSAFLGTRDWLLVPSDYSAKCRICST